MNTQMSTKLAIAERNKLKDLQAKCPRVLLMTQLVSHFFDVHEFWQSCAATVAMTNMGLGKTLGLGMEARLTKVLHQRAPSSISVANYL